GVILTAAGELLSREVVQVYRNLSRLGDLIADLEGLRRGRVTIYCMEGAADAWLPSILSRFHELHPDITFDLHVENTDRAVEALLLGDCDIAVTLKTQRRSEIKVVKRHAEKLVALVHPAHPLSARRSIDLATLLKTPLVMPDMSFGVRQVLERCAKKLGSSWVCGRPCGVASTGGAAWGGGRVAVVALEEGMYVTIHDTSRKRRGQPRRAISVAPTALGVASLVSTCDAAVEEGIARGTVHRTR